MPGIYYCCTDSRLTWTTYHICQQFDTRVAHRLPWGGCARRGGRPFEHGRIETASVTARKHSWFKLAHYICKFYIIYISVYPTNNILVSIRFCSHVLCTILTFLGRWFSHVGNAYGCTRHCRHCTLGCIVYSRVLCRFSLPRPLSRVPGTQSRRPSSLVCPRPFRHMQPRYFT